MQFFTAAVLLLGFIAVAQAMYIPPLHKCADNDTLDAASDGYQWHRQKDRFISALYREWWFFAVHDQKANVAWCMGYSVSDPLKTFRLQETGLAGMFWPQVEQGAKNSLNTNAQVFNVLDTYNFTDFSAIPENATVKITDANRIEVVSPQVYKVIGQSKDGALKWNLVFAQTCYACREVFEIPEAMQLDWISYMPMANVTGTIEHLGKVYKINTINSYHDHNYGAWPTNLFNWIWSQFNSFKDQFAVVMGSYHVPLTQKYIGYVFIRFRGQRLKLGSLCGDSFSLEPLDWQLIDGKKYSIHNRVTVIGKQYKLVMEYKAHVSDRNPGDRGLGILVYEQVSYYNAEFYQMGVNNQWQLVAKPEGYGFSEWSNVKF